MSTADERLQILKMIEEGKISASEGAELLRALARDSGLRPPEPLMGASSPRWFRVRVTDLATGKDKVNVNIPVGLVKVGMRMGARFAPEAEGVDLEELMEAVRGGAQGKLVDVVDDGEGEHIEIFVE
jgi:hypothetical protein